MLSETSTGCRRNTQFFASLHKLGYEIKIGKDISVRYIGNERFIRLQRNFGDDYSIEGIRRRILAQTRPEISRPHPELQKTYKFKGIFHKLYRVSGFRSLYYNYLYVLNEIKRDYGHKRKERESTPNQVYWYFRDDVRYIRRISDEAKLLCKHSIDTDVQLNAHKQELQNQLAALENQRRFMRNKLRSIKDDGKNKPIKDEISALSIQMKPLRREIDLCNEIESRSAGIKDKLHSEREYRRDKQAENPKCPQKNWQFQSK